MTKEEALKELIMDKYDIPFLIFTYIGIAISCFMLGYSIGIGN